MDRDTQQGHSFGVLLVAGRRLVVLKASGELVGVLEYLVHSSRHLASLKESFRARIAWMITTAVSPST